MDLFEYFKFAWFNIQNSIIMIGLFLLFVAIYYGVKFLFCKKEEVVSKNNIVIGSYIPEKLMREWIDNEFPSTPKK